MSAPALVAAAVRGDDPGAHATPYDFLAEGGPFIRAIFGHAREREVAALLPFQERWTVRARMEQWAHVHGREPWASPRMAEVPRCRACGRDIPLGAGTAEANPAPAPGQPLDWFTCRGC